MLKLYYSKGDTRWQTTVLDHEELVHELASAASLARWKLTRQRQVSEHASNLVFSHGGDSEQAIICLWNLRGRTNEAGVSELCADTDGSLPFKLSSGKTLLLGYDSHTQNFVGWDAAHNLRTSASANPILKVPGEIFSNVYPDGLAFCSCGKDEVVVVFQPDALINYICNLDHFHGAVSESEQNALVYMSRASKRLGESEIELLPPDRQISVKAIADCWASTNFRRCVLAAYGGRCAMCSGYRDAYLPTEPIHIVPTGQQGSSNKTSNGLCLCELHHQAFDQGLIAVLPNYRVVINQEKVIGIAGGYKAFVKTLASIIRLPAEPGSQPQAAVLEAALSTRGLQNDQLQPVRWK